MYSLNKSLLKSTLCQALCQTLEIQQCRQAQLPKANLGGTNKSSQGGEVLGEGLCWF